MLEKRLGSVEENNFGNCCKPGVEFKSSEQGRCTHRLDRTSCGLHREVSQVIFV